MTKHLIPILILAAAAPVFAEDPHKLIATVPFNFTAGEKMFPAGDYVLMRNSGSAVISLRSADAKNTAMLLTTSTVANRAAKAGSLLFLRVGEKYSLTEVWEPGTSTGSVITPSKADRELRSRSDVPSRARVSVALR